MTETDLYSRLGNIEGSVSTLVETLKTVQDICRTQGRDDERIKGLERFRAGVWAVCLIIVPVVITLAIKALAKGG